MLCIRVQVITLVLVGLNKLLSIFVATHLRYNNTYGETYFATRKYVSHTSFSLLL